MHKPLEHKIYEFEEYRLDAAQLMLTRHGAELQLPPKAAEILLVLVNRCGKIVSKNELLEAVWRDVIVEESNLYGYLHVLRNTLGDQANGKPYVETLRGRGYRFNAEARVVGEEESNQPTAGERTKLKARKRYVLAALVGLILIAGGFSAAYYFRGEHLEAADTGTENVAAWENFRKGSYHLGRITPHDLGTAAEYFQKAISLDPNYTRAYTGLARTWVSLSPCCDYPPTEVFPKAKDAVQKALETDERSAEAHSVMAGILFWFDWNWTAAENECRRAIRLDPSSADAHYAYAHLLANTGRHPEALAEIRRALVIAPANLRNRALEALFLHQAGKTDEAKDRLLRIVQTDPNFWLGRFHLSNLYIDQGMYSEAVIEAERAKEFSGASNYPIALKAYALAKSGKLTEARAELDALTQIRTTTSTYVPAYYFALIHNGLGEPEKTLAFLEQAYEQRDSMMVFLKVEPKWDNLRSDPRFVDLLRRMDLE